MYQDNYQRGGARQAFQAYSRMRIPPMLLPHVHQVHVINAIRANNQVDSDGLYARALDDVVHGENAAVFADVARLIEKVVTGKLKGLEVETAVRTLSGLHRIDLDDESYPNLRLFNHRFLNNSGLNALVTVLISDAAQLDAVTIDQYRGGENMSAAYGPRRTRQHKKMGKSIQALLKQFTAVDEPATREAAERYVEYRFLDHGNLLNYMRRAELDGSSRSERYLRKWFRYFDDAFRYPRPSRGRPKGSRTPRI